MILVIVSVTADFINTAVVYCITRSMTSGFNYVLAIYFATAAIFKSEISAHT